MELPSFKKLSSCDPWRLAAKDSELVRERAACSVVNTSDELTGRVSVEVKLLSRAVHFVLVAHDLTGALNNVPFGLLQCR